ncbi:MAG: tRNA (adenosine(37)-N6)-threonylcarbamoyltransferase complex ATPase subunit type 1 TsaE [Isosphaeraceae bacterium]
MRVTRLPEELSIEIDTETETDRLGHAIASAIEPNVVIGLVGPLGAGKTRLVRSVASGLGVDPESVSSPTYVLINEYNGRLPVFHLDAYRLPRPEMFEALGVAEYWERGGVCLVEWANLVSNFLPTTSWWITLQQTGGERRLVTIVASDLWRIENELRNMS